MDGIRVGIEFVGGPFCGARIERGAVKQTAWVVRRSDGEFVLYNTPASGRLLYVLDKRRRIVNGRMVGVMLHGATWSVCTDCGSLHRPVKGKRAKRTCEMCRGPLVAASDYARSA